MKDQIITSLRVSDFQDYLVDRIVADPNYASVLKDYGEVLKDKQLANLPNQIEAVMKILSDPKYQQIVIQLQTVIKALPNIK